jgi:UDP-N-acetylmuramoyl-tripeptide--D-alanyl-D-alanine ligase
MISRTIRQLKSMIRCETDAASDAVYDDVVFTGVSTDSRTLRAGNLFVPLAGETFDGHEFAKDAVRAGAAALLWRSDRPGAPEGVPVVRVKDTLAALQELASAYRRQLKVRVVGVTGSNGKTTTKDMVAACLATTYKVHKTEGNYNNHVGLPLTLLAMPEQTEMAVLEMGMSGRGEIELLSRIAEPEAAIITNIGEAHLMQLGTRDAIAKAKLEITSGMREGGLLIYNGDEPLLDRYLEEAKTPHGMLRFRFGTAPTNDCYPIAILQEQDRTSFIPNEPNMTFTIPLPGRHNVLNALAAIACARYMGVKEADIVRGLHELRVTGMRSEFVTMKNGAMLINDAYNASPTSMKAAIRMLTDLKANGRKIVVLGDMLELGEREEAFHREIGSCLDPDKIDVVLTYGKLASAIAEEAAKVFPDGRVKSFSDKDSLRVALTGLLEPGDLCLFKASRGMRLEEVIGKLLEP